MLALFDMVKYDFMSEKAEDIEKFVCDRDVVGSKKGSEMALGCQQAYIVEQCDSGRITHVTKSLNRFERILW